MKKVKNYIVQLMVSASVLTGCEANFTDINKSPDTVYEVDPVTFLYQVENQVSTAGATWTDSYACKLRWLQYCSNIWGYSTTNFTDIGFGSGMYNEYNTMGSYTRHIPYYIETKMPEKLESYTHLIEAARVLLIAKGIQTSDAYGSLVYTDGWGAREGKEDCYEPKFQTQEELYTLWNEELKAAVTKFLNSENQESIQKYDLAYNGDMTKWAQATNALRLRLALRLLKQKPEEAKAIAKEVLSSTAIFQSIDDSFILYFDNYWTTLGDWHSVIDMDRAAKPFMNYLKKYNDPRKRMFFQINNLTPENVKAYNDQETLESKKIPTDLTRWEGGTVSYDERASDPCYTSRYLNDIDMRPMNRPQTRLWKGAQDNGSAGGWVPVITYADFCFMASEFVLEGVPSTKSAQEWYEEGVRASLTQWSQIGEYCQINDYKAITQEEIDTFMAQEGIAWNPALAKEQIYCQSWVEHFKNNNESWALVRRTGMPNKNTTIVTFDPVMVLGQEQQIPRRKKFSYPAEGTPNYANQVKRFDEMAKNPDFGHINDEFGRIWWDKK